MRWRCPLLLLVAITACSLHREERPAIPAIPAEPVDHGVLGNALSHPKTMAWARRFCAKMATQPSTRLGLVPARPILPRLEAILAEYGVPREFAAVPAIESGYRERARGRHGELGLWQLRPATARRFGLRVSARNDERTHARYEDWPLALAAYNAGEGRVDRALARSPGATFWELADRKALPRVSREYVPKILAVVRVTSSPDSCSSLVAPAATLVGL
jgi:hypothetical protein